MPPEVGLVKKLTGSLYVVDTARANPTDSDTSRVLPYSLIIIIIIISMNKSSVFHGLQKLTSAKN